MKGTTSRALPRYTLYDLGGIAIAVIGLTMVALIGMGATESKPETESGITRLDGPAQALGNGTMRTYIEMSDGAPVAIGVALSEHALEGLPRADVHWQHMDVEHAHALAQEWVLEMPAVNPTAYRHVSFGWNPAGHEPAGIYMRPHFDVHFNTITDAERRTIVPDDPFWAEREARLPRAELVPAGYTPLGGGVPLMGVHWIDPGAAELNGATFTHTFLFGSWDGRMVFAEPMLTKAFLESKPDTRVELPLPPEVEEAGYHPTAYAIRWDEATREYRVSLEGLVEIR